MNDSERKEAKLDVEDDRTITLAEVQDGSNTNIETSNTNINQEPIVEIEPTAALDSNDAVDGHDDTDGDSEAETLIQSPEKRRNSVVEGSTIVHQLKVAGSEAGSIIIANTSDKENTTRKRKRSHEEGEPEVPSRVSSHHSSPLSSPVAQIHSEPDSQDSDASDHKSSPSRQKHSESPDGIPSPKKRRRRPSEVVAPSAHKRSKRSSIDNTERRETRSATYPRPSDDERSPSPEPTSRREHKRGASTQLTSDEFRRRKRGRPPLIDTTRNRSADRGSESSEESEPRTSRARPPFHKLTSHDHETMSPAKVGPRKWKDKNGRTYLARACASNDLDAARVRLVERPEDLNMEDNAGNTPLQIAALEGFERIVEFLLSKGAEVNVRNVDKDTPLIDAVERGQLDVVKLLLKYGANPRMGNAKGDEPYELVDPEDDNYDDIRSALAEAKDKEAKKTPGIDAFEYQNRDGTSSRAASAASPRDSPPIGPRSPPAFGSRRRTGRSESTRNDLLWQANTQENLAKLAGKGDVQGVASILSILEKAETESLIAAAKAGHEEVLQLLIAMGKPNSDPEPVRNSKLVPGYNTPMLAAIGRGHPDVVKLLAYQSGFNPTKRYREQTYFDLAEQRLGDRWEEEYNILKQAYDRYATARGRKASSPRKTRDVDKIRHRTHRSSSAGSAKKRASSPGIAEHKDPSSKPVENSRERRKASDSVLEKRRSGGSGDTADSSVAVTSDLDQNTNVQRKTPRTRRSQSDLAPVPALESEPSQKRRRLVTGKEHRSRQAPSSSSENEVSDMTELKQEDPPHSALKRTRVNSTPEPTGDPRDRTAVKKRRNVLESSPDDTRSRPNVPSTATQAAPECEDKLRDDQDTNKSRLETKDEMTIGLTTAVAAEDVKYETPPLEIIDKPAEATDPETLLDAEPAEAIEPVSQFFDTNEDESDDHYSPPPAVEPPETLEEEEASRQAQAEAERLAAEEQAMQDKERQAEEQRLAKEKALEEARIKQEIEDKRKQEEEQARREVEKQQQLKQEMESRRRQEQLDEERKRIERLPMLLARTAEAINQQHPEVGGPQWLRKYLPLYTVKTMQLDPKCAEYEANDEWVPNFQVAGLLLTKDLGLQGLSSLEKKPATEWQKHCMWKVARLKLSSGFESAEIPVKPSVENERVAEERFKLLPEIFWVRASRNVLGTAVTAGESTATAFMDHVSRCSHLDGVQLPRMPITLKTLADVRGPGFKVSVKEGRHTQLPNGVTPKLEHINGTNGI